MLVSGVNGAPHLIKGAVGDVLQQVRQHEGVAGRCKLGRYRAGAVQSRHRRMCIRMGAAPQPQRHEIPPGGLLRPHLITCNTRPDLTACLPQHAAAQHHSRTHSMQPAQG